MEITIGWWLLPLILTVVIWVIAANAKRPEPGSGYDWGFGRDIGEMVFLGVGIYGTLIVWLVYVIAMLVFS